MQQQFPVEVCVFKKIGLLGLYKLSFTADLEISSSPETNP